MENPPLGGIWVIVGLLESESSRRGTKIGHPYELGLAERHDISRS